MIQNLIFSSFLTGCSCSIVVDGSGRGAQIHSPPASGESQTEDPHLVSNRNQWVIRAFAENETTPLAGATIWGSYQVGEESFPLPDSTTNVNGEAAVDLSAIRGLRPIEQVSVEITAYVACPGYRTERAWTLAKYYNGPTESEASWKAQERIVLERGRTVSGRVLDARGAPVHNAEVAAGVWNSESGEWTESLDSACYLQWTDAGGRFSLDMGAVTVRDLAVTHYRAGTASLSIPPESLSELGLLGLEVQLDEPKSVVRGSVVAGGKAFVGRPRLFVDSETGLASKFSWLLEVPVDPAGRFELAPPAGGIWSVSPDYKQIQEFDASTENLLLNLTGHFAVIRVVDAFGRPVRGARPRVHALTSTPEGERPDYRGRKSTESSRVFSSWIHCNSSGGAVWTCRLPRPGLYSISCSVGDERKGWFADTTCSMDAERTVVDHDLVLQPSTRSGPVQITWLDWRGEPIPQWSGSLRSAVSGLQLDSVTDAGTPFFSCMNTTYSETNWRAGTYRLRLDSEPDGYYLPSESTITVRPNVPNPITLESPGLGGRAFMTATGRNAEDDAAQTIELTHSSSGRALPPHHLYRSKVSDELHWAATPTGGAGTAARLLEVGDWEWRVLGNGEELDAGTVHVQAAQDVTFTVNLADD